MPVIFSYLWTIHQRCLSLAAGALATVACIAAPSVAGIVTFGSGSNQFNMEFVTIGDVGNAADVDVGISVGAVGYEYGIGKFEVSEDMITKFNASQSLQIVFGSWGSPNKPATNLSWNEAARFVNWLNTSRGGFVAYKFTTGGVNDDIALWDASDTLDYDPLNPYRSKRATYVLPSSNEWHKAAYYKGGSLNAGYWIYTTGSDTAPTAVAGGSDAYTAVYDGQSMPAACEPSRWLEFLFRDGLRWQRYGMGREF